MAPKIQKAEGKMAAAKDKLSAYVSSNSGASLDQNNAEYYQLRTDHLQTLVIGRYQT